MEKEIRQCERCKRPDMEIVGVWCSVLGPVSFCGCKECLEYACEPFDIVKWFVLDAGGWKNLHPGLKQVYVYHGGKYVEAGTVIADPTPEEKEAYQKEINDYFEKHPVVEPGDTL